MLLALNTSTVFRGPVLHVRLLYSYSILETLDSVESIAFHRPRPVSRWRGVDERYRHARGSRAAVLITASVNVNAPDSQTSSASPSSDRVRPS
jgi:hypothetical protein